MSFTSDQLISGLKRRITMPSSQVLLDNSAILEMADDVILSRIVPLLLGVRQDYFVAVEEVDLVANQSEYNIPYRARARALRDLKMTDGTAIWNMALIALEDAHRFVAGNPFQFYFRGDKVVLVPTPNTTDYSLLMYYELYPSNLVETTDAALVVSATATVVTVASTVPATFTAGASVDFIKGKQGNNILALDKTILSASGTQITFAADVIPTDLVAGDWISIAQTSPVLQFPDVCYSYLETELATHILRAIGDYDGAARLAEDAKEDKKAAATLLEPRIQGEPTVIINRQGLLYGRWWGPGWRVRV